jgi:tripartite-type tricarboxylate transporter receptor subunit TctC
MTDDGWAFVAGGRVRPQANVKRNHHHAPSRDVVKIVAAPEMQERLAGFGYDAVGTTPEEFAAQIKAETAKWAKVIQGCSW